MTQAPMGYPAQPGYPQQQYPQAPQQPYAPPMQPGYAPQGYPQPAQFPHQGYPGQGPMGQQPPAGPPVQAGSIEDFYNQQVSAGGPGIGWKGKVEGTAYWGTVSGACTVQQDTDFNTKQPKFRKDGVTPEWVMLIPLSGVQTNHQGPAEFADGEAVYYARGKDKEELNRAVSEAGCSGAPQVGAQFMVSLVRRKPNAFGNPTNVVQIRYVPPNGQPHQVAGQQEAQAPAPAVPQAPPAQAPQQFQPQPQAPVQQEQPPQWAQPAPVQQPPAQMQQQQAPVQQMQAPLTGAPAVPGPVPPAGMAPETAQILAGLGVPAGVPAQQG